MLLVFSCGIEEYIYLEPVENVSTTGVSSAIITIPNNTSNPYFRYYTIFYRIYISDVSLAAIPSHEQRLTINPTLAAHYNTIDPYTTNDSVSPNAIASVFTNLKYHPLYVSVDKSYEIAMNQLLAKSETISGTYPSIGAQDIDFGDRVELVFTSADVGPYMVIRYNSFPDSDNLYLFRDGNNFTANPDRLFYQSADLVNEAFISTTTNIDVEPRGGANPKLVYVSMYILATGIDVNYTLVYSRPKHIGIFRLPVKP